MAGLATFIALDAGLFTEAFVLLFAVKDAVGTASIFLALNEGYPSHRGKALRQASL